jgi:hypothetical protein
LEYANDGIMGTGPRARLQRIKARSRARRARVAGVIRGRETLDCARPGVQLSHIVSRVLLSARDVPGGHRSPLHVVENTQNPGYIVPKPFAFGTAFGRA